MVKVTWMGHAGFLIEDGRTVYIDPYVLHRNFVKPADLVLATHDHTDHMSVFDIRRVANEKTTVVVPQIGVSQLKEIKAKEVIGVKPGDSLTVGDVKVDTIPMYNIAKLNPQGKPIHPKENGYVGYILTVEGTKIYHAGDTDLTPEMNGLEVDISLLPVCGIACLTAEEAAEATKVVKARVTVPMHYDLILGTLDDAKRFNRLASSNVVILNKWESLELKK